MVKNEEDIIGATVGRMLAEGVDHVLVYDNLSTDGTRDILESFENVTVINDPEVGYYQAEKMYTLSRLAGEMGASWIIPFDADELFYSPEGRIADVLPSLNIDVCWVNAIRHIPHPSDGDEPNPVDRMKWRNIEKMPGAKVAYRYHPEARLAMGNHNVDCLGDVGRREHGHLELREFQYRSFEHFVRKVRNGKKAYDATNLHQTCGIHWRQAGAMNDDDLRDCWADYMAIELVYDPAPRRVHEIR